MEELLHQFINPHTLDRLSEEAIQNPRLRMNKDMRTTNADQSQRMLNALEPGTQVPIHRHRKSTETVAVLRGSVKQSYYNDKGELILQTIIKASGDCPFYTVPQGMWHSTECLQSGTIIFESKDGAYEPLSPEDVLETPVTR